MHTFFYADRFSWELRGPHALPPGICPGLMILWAVVNMVFLRGAPPPFSLTWQYEEAAQAKAVSTVDQEIAGTSASFCQILMIPGLLQYAFSCQPRRDLCASLGNAGKADMCTTRC